MGLVVSLLLLGLSIIAFVASYGASDGVYAIDDRVSLWEDFYVSLLARGADARIVFFNDPEYGPSQGSVIGFGAVAGRWLEWNGEARRLGYCPGISYRYFCRPREDVWIMTVSLWYPIGLFALCALLTGWRWRRRRAREQPQGG